jgi:hypothetical protein
VAARNVNRFKDKDHIHFGLQRMEDGVTGKRKWPG